MKRLLTILAVLIVSFNSFSQSIVGRANSSYTVMDSRFMAQYNLFVPRYADTTAANLQKGIDTLGAVIFTYDNMSLMVRSGSPKVWTEIGSGGGGTWGSITGTLSDQTDLQSALDLKAPLASPTFTGTVTIPTPFTLGSVSVLPTGTELNFVDGVTSNIQTQIDGKQNLLVNSAGLLAALSDETGTGLSVFNTSPLFTTPRLASTSTTGYVWMATDASGNGSFQAIPNDNLLFDSLGAAGISPMTTWNNTLYARRISISGGSIDTTASGGLLITVSGGGITSLNGLTGATQTFATGLTGTDFNISSSGTTHTFNIPDAGASARGVVTTGTQTLAGTKTFSSISAHTGGLRTNTSAATSNFMVFAGGAGNNGLGTTSILLVEGAANLSVRTAISGTTNAALTGGDYYASFVIGNVPLTEASSGTHPLISSLTLRPPAITGAGAAVSNTATLYIEAAPTATVTGANYALWAKAGNVAFTNGNLTLGTAGNKLNIATGSNASVGVSAAMTAGTITISTTAVTANSIIILTHATLGGTQGILSVGTITAGTSFVINSSNAADTGTVNWWIVN